MRSDPLWQHGSLLFVMHSDILANAAALSDRELLKRLAALAGREREVSAELVAHLAEVDARRIHEAEGFGSLFRYCTTVLRLSEDAAYTRIEAARAGRRFPVILDLLAAGALSLTTVRLLAPHLTMENHAAVLKEASGRGKREVELLVARLAPRDNVASSVRKLPCPTQPPKERALPEPGPCPSPLASAPVATLPTGPARADATRLPSEPGPGVPTRAPEPPRPMVAPLAPERYKVQFTIGQETREKLQLAQDLLRREIPSGDPAAIFDRALTLLLNDVAKKKLAQTRQPRPAKPRANSRSRHVPAALKRAAWLRDRGQCGFIGKNGRRCGEKAFLEFHHIEPYAVGGEMTQANISLRCRRHNVHEAELVFGPYEGSTTREARARYVTGAVLVPEQVRSRTSRDSVSTAFSPSRLHGT